MVWAWQHSRCVATCVSSTNTQLQLNTQAEQSYERLRAELRDLRDGLEMVEERARFEIGMVKPNEIFVQIAK